MCVIVSWWCGVGCWVRVGRSGFRFLVCFFGVLFLCVCWGLRLVSDCLPVVSCCGVSYIAGIYYDVCILMFRSLKSLL